MWINQLRWCTVESKKVCAAADLQRIRAQPPPTLGIETPKARPPKLRVLIRNLPQQAERTLDRRRSATRPRRNRRTLPIARLRGQIRVHRDDAPIRRVRRRPHHEPVRTDEILGHAEVVIDAQERLAVLLLQDRLERAWFVHERSRPPLIIELCRQHFSVPDWGCPHPPILGPSGLRVVDLPQTRARSRAKPRALRASGG